MNLLALILSLLAAVGIFILPRKYAIVPLIVGSVLIPPSNGFILAGINFPVLRILLLCACLRLLARGEWGFYPSKVDRLVILWGTWVTVSYTLLTLEVGALINRIGSVWVDLVLTYFVTRSLLKDIAAVHRTVILLITMGLMLSVTTALEYFWRLNFFSYFGGIDFVQIRGEKLRCQGPFGHPIALGSFGAMAIPLVWGAYKASLIRFKAYIVSMVGCMAVVVCSGSSSPIFTLAGSLFAIFLWRFRKHMRQIVMAGFLMLIGLEIVMKAHVWWLIPRLNPMGGSAYHRAKLIDHFVANFGEWWLFGTRDNAEWGGGGYMTHDVANHLLRMGTAGGILAIIIFLITFVVAFKGIGRLVAESKTPPASRFLLWALGGVLFAHLVTFIGLSYWDQMRFVLYVHIGLVASAISIEARKLQASSVSENPAEARFNLLAVPRPSA